MSITDLIATIMQKKHLDLATAAQDLSERQLVLTRQSANAQTFDALSRTLPNLDPSQRQAYALGIAHASGLDDKTAIVAANAAHTSAESAKAMAFDYLLTKDKDKTLTDMGNVVATGRTPGQVSKENDYIGMTPQEHTYAGEIQGDVKLGASGTAQKDVGLANVRQNYAALGNQWNIAKLEFQGKLQTARDPSHAAALMNNLTALLKDAAQGTNTPGGAGMYNAAINSTIEMLAAEGIVVPIKHVDPKTGQETLGLNPDGDIKAPGFFGTMQRVPAAAADFGAGVVKRVAP